MLIDKAIPCSLFKEKICLEKKSKLFMEITIQPHYFLAVPNYEELETLISKKICQKY